MKKAISIPKFEESTVNEDAVRVGENFIAVSDGAGGGGVYADLWSSYLVNNLPEHPLDTFEKLDGWIGKIWEPFYNDCEEKARKAGGILLNKFYDEGSFATLAAIWQISENQYQWMTFGDSVVFHYDYKTEELEHSFTELCDFNAPPYLINCKDELSAAGFRTGVFQKSEKSVLFIASDTLAHYILMMYELSQKDRHAQEIERAIQAHSKNSILINNTLNSFKTIHFEQQLTKLLHTADSQKSFSQFLKSQYKHKWLGHDDYSFAVMG